MARFARSAQHARDIAREGVRNERARATYDGGTNRSPLPHVSCGRHLSFFHDRYWLPVHVGWPQVGSHLPLHATSQLFLLQWHQPLPDPAHRFTPHSPTTPRHPPWAPHRATHALSDTKPASTHTCATPRFRVGAMAKKASAGKRGGTAISPRRSDFIKLHLARPLSLHNVILRSVGVAKGEGVPPTMPAGAPPVRPQFSE